MFLICHKIGLIKQEPIAIVMENQNFKYWNHDDFVFTNLYKNEAYLASDHSFSDTRSHGQQQYRYI